MVSPFRSSPRRCLSLSLPSTLRSLLLPHSSPSLLSPSTLETSAFLSCGRRSLAHWCSPDEQTEKAVFGLKQDQRRAMLSVSNKFELSLNSRREDHSSVVGPNPCNQSITADNPTHLINHCCKEALDWQCCVKARQSEDTAFLGRYFSNATHLIAAMSLWWLKVDNWNRSSISTHTF